jgi:hypothetical protein
VKQSPIQRQTWYFGDCFILRSDGSPKPHNDGTASQRDGLLRFSQIPPEDSGLLLLQTGAFLFILKIIYFSLPLRNFFCRIKYMYRTTTCGELRLSNEGQMVTLAGWVQKARKMGGMIFVDIRDRYGVTQLVFNEKIDVSLCEKANRLGREYVIRATDTVKMRSN